MNGSYDKFLQNHQLLSFDNGQMLILKGDESDAIYVVENGRVASYTITVDGTERQVAMHFPGDDIPVGRAIGLRNQADFFYKAYGKCSVRKVPREDFLRELRSDPDTLMSYYMLAYKKLLACLGRIDALERPRASDKVAFMLMNLAEQLGTRIRPHRSQMVLSMTQQQMADAFGLTRETTGIELRKLELNKIISHSRKTYILYIERLKEYIDNR